MTSSDIARAVLVAMLGIAALLVTSAQLRVVEHPDRRARRYGVAWLVCVVVMTGLMWVTDAQVGNDDWQRRLAGVAVIGGIFAAALAAGAWWTARPASRSRGRAISLFLIHALVIVAGSWFFI